MTLLIGVTFAAILGALMLAGIFMVRGGRAGRSRSGNMAWALTVRIALSIALFVCILVAWKLGWIHPTSLPLGR